MSKETINELMGRVVRSPMPLRRPATYSPSAELNRAADLTALASNFSRPQSYGYGSASQIPRPNTAAAAPRPAPVAPAPAGGSNPYGFAASGSDQDTAANFFAADQRMRQAQTAKPAAPAPAPRSVAPPAPMSVPRPKDSLDPNTSAMVKMYSDKPNTTILPDPKVGTGAKGIGSDRVASALDTTPPYSPKTKDIPPVVGPARSDSGGGNDGGKYGRLGDHNPTPEVVPPKERNTSFVAPEDKAPKPRLNDYESESGPNKKEKDKKMSESTLINAFLKLQETEHSNIFEAAKKAKKDWDGDGKVESGKAEYLGSKIAAAKKAGKMKEEIEQVEEERMSKGRKDALARKTSFTADPPRRLEKPEPNETKSEKIKAYRADRDKHGEMEEEVEQINEIGDTKSGQKLINMVHKRASDRLGKAVADKDPKNARKYQEVGQQAWDRMPSNKYDEEVQFSEEELAHFEAVIARKDQKGKEKGIGDTVDSADLTDEYINEMAARGVKAGQKRGSYKKKATDLQGNRAAAADAEPDEGSKGVPHVLDQIRHGQEDEHGFKSITHPASSTDAPVTKKIHRSDLHGFYDRYHNTEKPAGKEKEYSSFLGKHFGDERTSSPTSKAVTLDNTAIAKSNAKGNGVKVSLGGSSRVGGSKQ